MASPPLRTHNDGRRVQRAQVNHVSEGKANAAGRAIGWLRRSWE